MELFQNMIWYYCIHCYIIRWTEPNFISKGLWLLCGEKYGWKWKNQWKKVRISDLNCIHHFVYAIKMQLILSTWWTWNHTAYIQSLEMYSFHFTSINRLILLTVTIGTESFLAEWCIQFYWAKVTARTFRPFSGGLKTNIGFWISGMASRNFYSVFRKNLIFVG